ncbi:hypothetical protein WJX77_011933 [Trebouxia sp. C0004]
MRDRICAVVQQPDPATSAGAYAIPDRVAFAELSIGLEANQAAMIPGVGTKTRQ